MSSPATAAGADLAPTIRNLVKPDSHISVEHNVDTENRALANVTVDGEIVATFYANDSTDHSLDALELAQQIRDHQSQLRRAEFALGLRLMADFFERHPHLPLPNAWAWRSEYYTTPSEFRAYLEALPAGTDLHTLEHDDQVLELKHHFGPVELAVRIKADKICEQRTETRQVAELVLPDWAGGQPVTKAAA